VFESYAAWRGLRDDKLSQLTGIPNCIFARTVACVLQYDLWLLAAGLFPSASHLDLTAPDMFR